MPPPEVDAQALARSRRERDLDNVVMASAVTAAGSLVVIGLVAVSGLFVMVWDWQAIVTYLWFLVVVPPVLALVLTALAAGCAAAARRTSPRVARRYRGLGLLLGYLALAGTVLEVVLGAAWYAVARG